ncbi:unnamed protein product [Nesidiocoris tenuis]|uniref:Uncharacterized protein n=1 Tax=Nesidiocoris tenuis TaxID=355587 RepID=A0A6H5HFN5_9HEMI|nr:unnamed protein product [Nesidiocoris tenuis]
MFQLDFNSISSPFSSSFRSRCVLRTSRIRTGYRWDVRQFFKKLLRCLFQHHSQIVRFRRATAAVHFVPLLESLESLRGRIQERDRGSDEEFAQMMQFFRARSPLVKTYANLALLYFPCEVGSYPDSDPLLLLVHFHRSSVTPGTQFLEKLLRYTIDPHQSLTMVNIMQIRFGVSLRLKRPAFLRTLSVTSRLSSGRRRQRSLRPILSKALALLASPDRFLAPPLDTLFRQVKFLGSPSSGHQSCTTTRNRDTRAVQVQGSVGCGLHICLYWRSVVESKSSPDGSDQVK